MARVISSTDSFPHSVWSQNRSYWIGGRREDSFWRWKGIRTGPVGIDRWAVHEPNTAEGQESCIELANDVRYTATEGNVISGMTMTAL